jgi:foldase protein PrsA
MPMRPNLPPGMMPPPPPSGPPSDAQLKPGPTVTLPATLNISGVAAIVNGEKITNTELIKRFLVNGGQPTLKELITELEVDQAARKAHVVVTASEIDSLLKTTKIQLLQQSPGQTWTQFLEAHGLSEDYARDQMRMELTVDKLAVSKQAPFTLAGKIHVYHILIATTPLPYASSSHSDAEAQTLIKSIKAQIDAGTITFQNAAKKYSEDHSNAPNGGDLGWISQTDPLDSSFKQAAFALKQGQISDPVKSQFGWHLIYLAKIGSDATPAEVQKASDDTLQERARPLVGQIVQQLQASAVVEDVLIPIPPQQKPPAPMMMPQRPMPGPGRPMPQPGPPPAPGAGPAQSGKTPPAPPL